MDLKPSDYIRLGILRHDLSGYIKIALDSGKLADTTESIMLLCTTPGHIKGWGASKARQLLVIDALIDQLEDYQLEACMVVISGDLTR
jgi:hypothetical protein